MAKHSEKRNRRKIIQLKDHQPESLREEETPEEAPKAAVEYDGEPEEEAGSIAKVTCPRCGHSHDMDDPKCPYCGAENTIL